MTHRDAVDSQREVMSSTQLVLFTRDDLRLIVNFAGCSLDEKPGSNWV